MFQPLIVASERPWPEDCEGVADPASDGEVEADGSLDGPPAVGCSALDDGAAGADGAPGDDDAVTPAELLGDACSVAAPADDVAAPGSPP